MYGGDDGAWIEKKKEKERKRERDKSSEAEGEIEAAGITRKEEKTWQKKLSGDKNVEHFEIERKLPKIREARTRMVQRRWVYHCGSARARTNFSLPLFF